MREYHESDLFTTLLNKRETYRDLMIDIPPVDSLEALGDIWEKISDVNIELLIVISKYAKLLHERYLDEFDQLNVDIKDTSNVVNLIKGNIETQIRIAQLLRIYIWQLSQGVLDQNMESEHSGDAEIIMEELLDNVFSFFFKSTQYHQYVEHLAEEMNELRKFDNRIRLREKFNDNQKETLMIEYNISDGLFLLNQFLPALDTITGVWWEDDPIIKYSVNKVIVDKFEKIEEIEEKEMDGQIPSSKLSRMEKIRLVELPRTKSKKSLALIELYYRIAMKQARVGKHTLASKHFEKLTKNIDKVFLHIGSYPSGTEMEQILTRTEKLNNKINLLSRLNSLASLYSILHHSLFAGQFEKCEVVTEKLIDKLSEIKSEVDIRYISSLPMMYESISSTTMLMLEMDSKLPEIARQIYHIVMNFVKRLEVGINQVTTKIEELNEKNPDLLSQISRIKQDTRLLLEGASLLPEVITERQQLIDRITIIYDLIRSIDAEMQENQEDTDKIRALMIKVKAYYYAKEAKTKLNQSGFDDLPIKRINAHLTGSFVSGKNIEIQIYQFIIQYLTLSEVIPSYYLMIHQEPTVEDEHSLDYYKQQINQPEFNQTMKSLKDSYIQMKEFNQSHGGNISGVNWENINISIDLVEGVILLKEAIKKALIGQIADTLSLTDDTKLLFQEASRFLFDASEKLEGLVNLNIDDLKDIPNHVYSFGQFCQSVYNDPDTLEREQIPFSGIFKMLRDLIFTL